MAGRSGYLWSIRSTFESPVGVAFLIISRMLLCRDLICPGTCIQSMAYGLWHRVTFPAGSRSLTSFPCPCLDRVDWKEVASCFDGKSIFRKECVLSRWQPEIASRGLTVETADGRHGKKSEGNVEAVGVLGSDDQVISQYHHCWVEVRSNFRETAMTDERASDHKSGNTGEFIKDIRSWREGSSRCLHETVCSNCNQSNEPVEHSEKLG